MSKHADHTLLECSNPDLCQQKPVWQITRNRTGTSHAKPSTPSSPVGRVIVTLADEFGDTELYRKIGSMQWEKI